MDCRGKIKVTAAVSSLPKSRQIIPIEMVILIWRFLLSRHFWAFSNRKQIDAGLFRYDGPRIFSRPAESRISERRGGIRDGRSEERRVGKECRSEGGRGCWKKRR